MFLWKSSLLKKMMLSLLCWRGLRFFVDKEDDDTGVDDDWNSKPLPKIFTSSSDLDDVIPESVGEIILGIWQV